jgi:hypothetical protein
MYYSLGFFFENFQSLFFLKFEKMSSRELVFQIDALIDSISLYAHIMVILTLVIRPNITLLW